MNFENCKMAHYFEVLRRVYGNCRSIHIPKIFQVFTVFGDQVYTGGDFPRFLTDPEHFGNGFVLSFTRRYMNPK